MRDWTRRRFLTTAATGTAAASVAMRADATPLAARPDVSSAWPDSVGAALRAAMDVLVPAEGGMPAAGEAGVLAYLEGVATRDADVRRQLRRAASALEKRSHSSSFPSLPVERRARVLAELETKEPAIFEALRDYVYEGYYTRPEIWKRLGFEFYGPDRPGPGLPRFDEAFVEQVRRRPPLYRNAT